MTRWIKEIGPDSDIVISSRMRLARNLREYPFPIALTKEKSKQVIQTVYHAVEGLDQQKICGGTLELWVLEEISPLERQVLLEKHLISPNLLQNHEKGAVLLNQDESISIMINEEDHIRIQCLLSGTQLDAVFQVADRIDDVLEEKLEYAFDEQFGYLSSCPTNVGTGIRASVMMHLPALAMTGYIDRILQVANHIGLAVRGVYGEGTEFVGNMYQISNQLTLGRSEKEIISNLKDVTKQIIKKERDARSTLLTNNRVQLEDKIYRSFGILAHARVLNSDECMQLLSDVRLGIDLGLIQEVNIEKINEIMILIQPACIQKIAQKHLSANERDMRRASLVREKLKG